MDDPGENILVALNTTTMLCSWLACSWTECAPLHFFSRPTRVSTLWQCKFEFLFWVAMRWDVNLALTSGRPVAETLGDKLLFCQILLVQSFSRGTNASKTIRSIFFRRVSQLFEFLKVFSSAFPFWASEICDRKSKVARRALIFLLGT